MDSQSPHGASAPAAAHASLVEQQPRVSTPDRATLLRGKIALSLNRVMATFLSQLEQLADEHDEAMGKLMDALPEGERAKVMLADIYGETRFDAIRRTVLKVGNGERRELEEMCEYAFSR